MTIPQGVFPKDKLHMNVARLKKSGQTFEVVLGDVDKAYNLRYGKEENVREVIRSEHIFFDAKKGNLAAEDELEKIFGTRDVLVIAKKIILSGEINLTAEQRNRIFDIKKKKIIQYIHENGFDPTTKLPHPIQRIENALNQANISINPDENFDFLLKKVIEKIKVVLPISFEKISLRIHIPREFAAQAYSAAKKKYSFSYEKWENDGSVTFELEIVAGVKAELFSLINKLTNGTAEIEEKK